MQIRERKQIKKIDSKKKKMKGKNGKRKRKNKPRTIVQ